MRINARLRKIELKEGDDVMSTRWLPRIAPEAAPRIELMPTVDDSTVAPPETGLVEEIEEWVRTSAKPSAPVMWCPFGHPENAIGGADQLARKVATLADIGEWAVARRTHGWTWAQCLRVEGGWIVEVNGIPGPDCFARRVTRAGTRRWLPPRRREVRRNGHLMALYARPDVIRTTGEVGAIMWSWLRGGLPEGFELQAIKA
ncbi:hypothetical protein [Microbacterium hominis]|uniref:Uncharacterized protein n=1 Tax=Microbacterium hominis TaxID=162426 RepID=A0A7D4U3E7_9MICO|nr:hypothetical protein [Microbacterium hominis]QKJ18585.1 hypothetical protein HQM25_03750 [Microbacterium hominis]